MSRLPKQMGAGDFKARCLRVLDEAAASKREVVIIKRGRLVAKVVPLAPSGAVPLKGLIVRQDDLVSPLGIAIEAGLLGSDFHGDPADRIIVATALDLRVPLVTRDQRIRSPKLVDTVW